MLQVARLGEPTPITHSAASSLLGLSPFCACVCRFFFLSLSFRAPFSFPLASVAYQYSSIHLSYLHISASCQQFWHELKCRIIRCAWTFVIDGSFNIGIQEWKSEHTTIEKEIKNEFSYSNYRTWLVGK